jgi:hypothetical protein
LNPYCRPNLYLALTHYPVVNKRDETIASAVTNLDIHDLARAARTYNLRAFYIVTPLEDQKMLVNTLISHWTEGVGSTYNPKRCRAFQAVYVRNSLEDVMEDIALQEKRKPGTVVTSAKEHADAVSMTGFREILKTGDPYLLVFGTAWGLSRDYMDKADYILEPIRGHAGYNHLSVRSAASIILDRLLSTP